MASTIYWFKYAGHHAPYNKIIFSSRRYRARQPSDVLIVAVMDKVNVRIGTRYIVDNQTGNDYTVPVWRSGTVNKIISAGGYGPFIKVKYKQFDRISARYKRKYMYVDLNAIRCRDGTRKHTPMRVYPRWYVKLNPYNTRRLMEMETIFFHHYTNL